MLKPIGIQYVYKKKVGFTKTQQETLIKLESYGINVNQFIRQAVKEKIQRDWKMIKESKTKFKTPF